MKGHIMQTWLPIITFLGVSVLLISLYLLYERREKKTWIKKRLQPSGKKEGIKLNPKTILNKILLMLGSFAMPSGKEDRSGIRKKLLYAGYRDDSVLQLYSGLRILFSLVFGGFFFLIQVLMGRTTLADLLLTAIPLAVGYYLPQVMLKFQVQSRNMKIFIELPDTLDLLVVCIEAGLGFEMALYRVSGELKDVAPVLSKEFAQYFFETRSGMPRGQTLIRMKERNGDPGFHAVIDVIIQSFKFGTDIAGALRVHSEAMRTERQQIAEEKGAKVAAKLTLPLVLLILPVLLIVMLGPAMIRLLTYFSG